MKVATVSIVVLFLVAIALWMAMWPVDNPVDPELVRSPQQILYDECVAARDHEIHQKTFATIDNPDVQREVLATQKDIAKRECREKFPNP